MTARQRRVLTASIGLVIGLAALDIQAGDAAWEIPMAIREGIVTVLAALVVAGYLRAGRITPRGPSGPRRDGGTPAPWIVGPTGPVREITVSTPGVDTVIADLEQALTTDARVTERA